MTTAPTETPPRADSAGGDGPRRAALRSVRRGWRKLTSMRTALLLLFLLAAAAVPGSYFPQRGLNPGAVARYLRENPRTGELLDALGLFDVYAAPWFVGLYLLLAVSLVGCVTPRIRLHWRALRRKPPAPPRHLGRLPFTVSAPSGEAPEPVADRAAALLRRRRWRVVRRTADDGALTVSAEKGYARETGNLLFHVSLLALLAGVAIGALYGYKGTTLVVEGDTFANTPIAYDELFPGRRRSVDDLPPFSVRLEDFRARYLANGQAESFEADVTVRRTAGAPAERRRLRVNEPLTLGGARVYLLSHGYALHFTVTMPDGTVVHDQWTPFLPQDASLLSTGVVKIPDIGGGLPQLGIRGVFLPTFGATSGGLVYSRHPAAQIPVFSYEAWAGDLGLDDGVPQNVYELDTTKLTRTGQGTLLPGETAEQRLAGGATLRFDGVTDFAVLQITDDPGKELALGAAAAGLLGLILSLRVRRRRIWVRVVRSEAGSLVGVGGLARQDPEGFRGEFAALAERIAGVRPPDPDDEE